MAHLLKCENLVPPKNGFLQYSHSLDEGSVVTYSCIKGFEIRQRGSTRKVKISIFPKVPKKFQNFQKSIFIFFLFSVRLQWGGMHVD